jgi:hypothetical protein
MNKKQLIILWVAIVLLVVTWGYPNWIVDERKNVTINRGFSLFWKSPRGNSIYNIGRINIERSVVQSIIIVLIFAGLFVTFKDKK